MSANLHKPCLILNQDYTPLQIIGWQRAICLEILGKEIIGEGVRVIEYYDDYAISGNGDKFPIPAVAVTNVYVKRRKKVALRKRNLLIRDNFECQYCGQDLNMKTATIDHVNPKSKFRHRKQADTWDNTVISCYKCNSKKDDRTPEQAGMKLKSIPREPDPSAFYKGIGSVLSKLPQEWETYVPV